MMKLSEAIRLGSTLAPQAFGNFKHGGGTCALGAAWEAVCGDIGVGILDLPSDWSWTGRTSVECPACDAPSGSVTRVITHLNDDHRWTREAIADWVKTLEDRMETAAQVKEEEQHVSDHETVGSY